jgi:hypothetical protein
VPSGEIVFEPDAARGNKGPQGRARISQGEFETVEGRGVVAGAIIAKVLAHDGKVQAEAPFGAPLCAPLTIHLDLPSADSRHELSIPRAKMRSN